MLTAWAQKWASEQITGLFGTVLGVWAPGAGWETAAEDILVDHARALLAARPQPLTIGKLTSLHRGRRISTRLRVEAIGGYHTGSGLYRLLYHRDGPLVEDIGVPQPIGQPAQRYG